MLNVLGYTKDSRTKPSLSNDHQLIAVSLNIGPIEVLRLFILILVNVGHILLAFSAVGVPVSLPTATENRK